MKFVNYTIVDYKNKLKKPEKEKVDEIHKAFKEEELKDHLIEFLRNLKELHTELLAFESIKGDLNNIRKHIEGSRTKQTKLNNELSKVRSLESSVVSVGMFKKIAKAEKISQLETQISEVKLIFK